MLRQKTIIRLLNKLDEGWDSRYQLFADNGSLALVDFPTGEVIESFIHIDCDGGDPDHQYLDGKEYIINKD